MLSFRFAIPCLLLGLVDAAPIVITGATGQTGALTYNLLKSKGVEVRGFVRNVTKAKELLGCDKCDESEGIFVGDILDKASMTKVMTDAGGLVILTSSVLHCTLPYPQMGNCTYSKGAFPIDIDWVGAKNTLEAFAETSGVKPVVLVSTFGTTQPDSPFDMIDNGQIAFYKLNMEAALMSSGLPFTIIAPCGLGFGKGNNATIQVGHDDELTSYKIEREDLARVVAAAASAPDTVNGLRFELCATAGAPTTDAQIPGLFKEARYPWQTETARLIV